MVLARKYRPKTLSDVEGQPAVVQILSNSFARNSLHHAYLFAGHHGSGKTSTARILATMENCLTSPGLNPCGICTVCKKVFEGKHADIVELDAASQAGKVKEIRELKNAASFSPIEGAKTKYFIIDEAHAMSTEGADALLKLLEEPPAHVRFILCTTELEAIIPTIRSRCQMHEFKKIYWRQIAETLEKICVSEKIKCDRDAIIICARLAKGSMRNALQNLEKLSDFAGDKPITTEHAQAVFSVASELLYYDLFDQIFGVAQTGADSTKAVRIITNILMNGTEFGTICDDIHEYLRVLLIGSSSSAAKEFIMISDEAKRRLTPQLKICQSKLELVKDFSTSLFKRKLEVEHGLSPEAALIHWFFDCFYCLNRGA